MGLKFEIEEWWFYLILGHYKSDLSYWKIVWFYFFLEGNFYYLAVYEILFNSFINCYVIIYNNFGYDFIGVVLIRLFY